MYFLWKKKGTNSGDFSWVPTNFEKCLLFIYNKLNKLQIKLLWVFINSKKVLGSIKNKKFQNLSDPLISFSLFLFFTLGVERVQFIPGWGEALGKLPSEGRMTPFWHHKDINKLSLCSDASPPSISNQHAVFCSLFR